jgi:hypothetical protein
MLVSIAIWRRTRWHVELPCKNEPPKTPRPLSLSQAAKRRIGSWVGDDQRIPGVVCFLLLFLPVSELDKDPR